MSAEQPAPTEPARRARVLSRYASLLARSRYLELLRARWMFGFALGAFAIGGFMKLTSEVSEGELDKFDQAVLDTVIKLRTPGLNGAAVDITALGSVTVLTLIVVIAVLLLARARDVVSISQLLIASLGGSLGSTVLKRVLERARPPEVGRLVEVASFSYPSGHSLASATIYLTIALVLMRRQRETSWRILFITLATALAFTIGASRAYLGVHYPSDIAAGLMLGSGWALVVSAAYSYARARGAAPVGPGTESGHAAGPL